MEMIDRIIELCNNNDLKGTDLGRMLGLRKSPLTDWKNSKSSPTITQIITICEIFGISSDYLLFGDEHKISISQSTLINKDERELLENYRKLDSRRQHHIQLLVYDEVDEQDKERRLRAGESYESVFGPSQEEPRPTRPPVQPRIPYVAVGGDKITPEADKLIQEKLQAMEEEFKKYRKG